MGKRGNSKGQIRCILSAVVSALLIVGVINCCLWFGSEPKVQIQEAREVYQSDVVVGDFVHDNYIIGENNPWTDYKIYPIQYSKSNTLKYNGKIAAKGVIVVDIRNKNIIYSKNENKKLYPASTTKLMTALTVLQNVDMDKRITVGDEIELIAADSSRAGFSKGQTVTVKELMHGMLIASGNDAAYILAKAVGEEILYDNIANEGKRFTAKQCVERFVYEMNKNVGDMELKNTHFESPDGYDENNQYTTASDLSKIAIRAYENETVRDICKKSSSYSETLNKTWKSTNKLIDKEGQYYCKYCVGMKTGSTVGAGKCLVSVAEKKGKEIVVVVLNSTSEKTRFGDSRKLIESALK